METFGATKFEPKSTHTAPRESNAEAFRVNDQSAHIEPIVPVGAIKCFGKVQNLLGEKKVQRDARNARTEGGADVAKDDRPKDNSGMPKFRGLSKNQNDRSHGKAAVVGARPFDGSDGAVSRHMEISNLEKFNNRNEEVVDAHPFCTIDESATHPRHMKISNLEKFHIRHAVVVDAHPSGSNESRPTHPRRMTMSNLDKFNNPTALPQSRARCGSIDHGILVEASASAEDMMSRGFLTEPGAVTEVGQTRNNQDSTQVDPSQGKRASSYRLTPAPAGIDETETVEPTNIGTCVDADCEIAPAQETFFSRHKKMMIAGIILMVILVLSIAVPVALGSRDGKDNSNESKMPSILNVDPTLLPDAPNSTWMAMSDIASPQYKAYVWVIDDPNIQYYQPWQLQQRFALAVFYYTMGGYRWEQTNWLNYELNECEWLAHNTTCNEEGDILLLNVTQQRGLRGSLPLELNLLTKLEGIDLSNNIIGGNLTSLIGGVWDHPSLYILWCEYCRLGGSFPSQMTRMGYLMGLILNNNEITGSLPSEMGQMGLMTLQMVDNKLTGSIPSTIGNMNLLENLELNGNQLEWLPPEIGNVTSLRFLDLSNNVMAQSIPPEIWLLTNLEHLALAGNAFVGTIPTKVGGLTVLRHLYLNMNSLSGTIPEELAFLNNLTTLQLYNNRLTGSITPSIFNMTSLQTYDVANNKLEGPIPSEFGVLMNLTALLLSNNRLTGSIPPEIGGLPLKQFTVDRMSGILPPLPLFNNCTSFEELWTDWCEKMECCV